MHMLQCVSVQSVLLSKFRLQHVQLANFLHTFVLQCQKGAREERTQGARDCERGGDAGGVCTPGRPTDRGGVHRRQGTSSGRGEEAAKWVVEML